MSSRVLRKLHGDDNLISAQDENSDLETSELTPSKGAKKKKRVVNRYDLFNQLSQSESEAKEDDDLDNEIVKHESSKGDSYIENVGDDLPRKKRKKKKKFLKSTSNQISSDDNIEVDEVERSVLEVNRILGETFSTNQSSCNGDKHASSSRKGILGIEPRHLNPNNELKRIFGSKIIQNEQNKRRARGRGHIKSKWLVAERENWPPVGKQGISMRLVESNPGFQLFKLEHNSSYQQVQQLFLKAVNSLNPENIVAIINSHPYHVDALLQLSDMCKMSEDLQTASELNERILFCLESVFHPSFNVALGNCRLDYRRQENRSLFIALFKHLVFVGQRACYRTALEFCKLLLSLDPEEDPMAVVLCIDFYAIKAGEYEWLLQAGREWEAKKNLSQLPNFAFSLAVAQYYVSSEGNLADEMLQDALIMFPSVLIPLLEKCSVIVDARVTKHIFFSVLNQVSQRPALTQLVQLYIARSYHVWKESALLPWLERNVHHVLDRVDSGDVKVADCHDKRMKRYHKPPRPVLRHIILSDMKEVSALLTESVDESVLSYDPLPPLDSINIYTPPVRSRFHDDGNAFAMFFRSILPNFNVNQPAPEPDQQVIRDEAEGAAGPVNDIRHSLTTLVDAMRELLANISVASTADAVVDGSDPDSDDDTDEDVEH